MTVPSICCTRYFIVRLANYYAMVEFPEHAALLHGYFALTSKRSSNPESKPYSANNVPIEGTVGPLRRSEGCTGNGCSFFRFPFPCSIYARSHSLRQGSRTRLLSVQSLHPARIYHARVPHVYNCTISRSGNASKRALRFLPILPF